MRYCLAKREEYLTSKAYRIYMTDAVRILTENTARAFQGKYLEERWIDRVSPRKEDNRTAEDIKQHMLEGLNGGRKTRGFT